MIMRTFRINQGEIEELNGEGGPKEEPSIFDREPVHAGVIVGVVLFFLLVCLGMCATRNRPVPDGSERVYDNRGIKCCDGPYEIVKPAPIVKKRSR
jgi:hypothetical protein